MTIQWYSPNVISPDLQTSSAISAAVQMWPWHIEAIFCHGWLEWGPQDAYEYRENLKNTILQMDMSRLHVIAMIKSAFTNLVCTVIQIYIHQPNEWWSIAFNQTQSCWGFWMMNFPFLCQETHLVSFHGFIGNGWIVKHKKHPVKKLGNVLLEISVYIYVPYQLLSRIVWFVSHMRWLQNRDGSSHHHMVTCPHAEDQSDAYSILTGAWWIPPCVVNWQKKTC